MNDKYWKLFFFCEIKFIVDCKYFFLVKQLDYGKYSIIVFVENTVFLLVTNIY